EASSLFPADQAAKQALARARAALNPPPAKVDYNDAMKRGAAAENNLKYDDALKAYHDALTARPKDQAATAKANFAQAIVNTEQAIRNNMKMVAAREIAEALRLQPKNGHALKLKKQVDSMK